MQVGGSRGAYLDLDVPASEVARAGVLVPTRCGSGNLHLNESLSMTKSVESTGQAEMSPPVEIAHGRVRGRREGGLFVFRGIPYGADTGGDNRFRPPQPPAPWTGVRDASRFGPIAVQRRPPGGDNPLGSPGMGMGEDCLVLNLWTPDLSGRRPVMVWLHGGGYTVGNGASPLYDGAGLARRGDVVVVTLNHRLGLLGHLFLEDHLDESFAGSGNAGTLDLIAALRWVRDNIAAFGGDPEAVTAFGESGGGGKLSCLLASPRSRGLFHRAIVQSGPPFQIPDRETAGKVTAKVLDTLDLGSQPARTLRELPVDKLLSVQIALGAGGGPSPGGMSFAPVVDGEFLLAHPEQALSEGAASEVPLLVGTNRDEARFMAMMNPRLRRDPPELSDDELIERVEPGCERGAADLVARYRAFRPELSNFDLLLEIESEQFRVRSIRLAEAKVAGATAPVGMYLFDWTCERLKRWGAYHGLEIPFIFDTRTVIPPLREAEGAEQLVERMVEAWAGFAHAGALTSPKGVAAWPAYRVEERATMCIGQEWRVEHDPLGVQRKAWDDIPTGPSTRPWSRVNG